MCPSMASALRSEPPSTVVSRSRRRAAAGGWPRRRFVRGEAGRRASPVARATAADEQHRGLYGCWHQHRTTKTEKKEKKKDTVLAALQRTRLVPYTARALRLWSARPPPRPRPSQSLPPHCTPPPPCQSPCFTPQRLLPLLPPPTCRGLLPLFPLVPGRLRGRHLVLLTEEPHVCQVVLRALRTELRQERLGAHLRAALGIFRGVRSGERHHFISGGSGGRRLRSGNRPRQDGGRARVAGARLDGCLRRHHRTCSSNGAQQRLWGWDASSSVTVPTARHVSHLHGVAGDVPHKSDRDA